MSAIKWLPRTISFSAGGARTVANLGMLARLIDLGGAANVTRWYGCSGGAICAFFGALGVSTGWLREVVKHFDMRCIVEVEDSVIENLFQTWGVNSGDSVRDFVGRFADTWEPGASQWTFRELHRQRGGVELHILATDLVKRDAFVFSYATTPDVLITEAIRASSTIPFLFTPSRVVPGTLLCDGAVIENYPWDIITSDKSDVLVVSCNSHPQNKQSAVVPDSLSAYVQALYRTVRKRQPAEQPRNWISVKSTISIFDFDIAQEERLGLFDLGVSAAEGWWRFREEVSTMRPAVSPEMRGNQLQSVAPDTSCVSRSHPDRMSGSPEYHNPPQPPCPSRGLPRGVGRRVRRWSL